MRNVRAVFSFLGAFLLVAVLSGGAIFMHNFRTYDRVLLRTVVGDLKLGGLTRTQAKAALHYRLDAYLDEPFAIAARGEVQQVTLRELGVAIDESALFKKVPFARDTDVVIMTLRSIGGKRVAVEPRISSSSLLASLYKKFPSIPQSRNAHFEKQGRAFVIVDGVAGARPNVDLAVATLQQNVPFFTLPRPALTVEFQEAPPVITKSDLESFKAPLTERFPQKIALTHDKDSWGVDFSAHPEWIELERAPEQSTPNANLPFVFKWSPLSFAAFVSDVLMPRLEQPAEDVSISLGTDGKAQFDGRGIQGQSIDQEPLLAFVNNAINVGTSTVAVPLVVVEPKITISEELQTMGVRDLISTGYTRFEGSPVNRAFNIGVGVSKLNGIIVQPGADFSFGKNIGAIDGTTGYRKELVIKPEGTIPEYGGGICQVSSTMYRAALFAGMPIKKRSPHSYAVSYYAQVLGPGLDSTVYPPQVDLVFTNDTPGAVVIHSYVDGPSATFKFYGTKDDRKVEMEGPFITNRHSNSPAPIMVYDPSLKPGQQKVVEKAHGGFDALWYRNLTKNGTSTKEAIVSKYRATENKVLTGDKPADPVAPTEGVNPLE